MVAVVATGCRGAPLPSPLSPPPALQITQSPSPKYLEVTAGPVSAVLPQSWEPQLAGPLEDARQGLVAAPRPEAGSGERPPTAGFAAMWIDGTRVGVPSDYYYLAATSPALDLLTHASQCSATRERVIVDHRPEFVSGDPNSPGDYVAYGHGTCTIGRQPSRWAYFVAAPGYGPVRELGIPSSGLYLVVAVVPDSPRAPRILDRLLDATRFGGATVGELIAAARPVTFKDLGPI